jgi:thioredoxin 1
MKDRRPPSGELFVGIWNNSLREQDRTARLRAAHPRCPLASVIFVIMRINAVRLATSVLLLFFAVAAMAQYASPPKEQDKVSARLRQLYPDSADAKKEIAEAFDTASKEHKRVLLVFGASWCFDCYALDYRFHQPNIQPLVEKNYRVVHVDIGRADKNLDVARKYETPVEAIPAIAVVDAGGKLLYSQKQHEFSSARSLDPKVIVAFLQKWKPPTAGHIARSSGQ